MSDNQTLRDLMLQVLETGRQSAAGEQTADDPAAEFARFVGEQLNHNDR
jgi:hypothetical protein